MLQCVASQVLNFKNFKAKIMDEIKNSMYLSLIDKIESCIDKNLFKDLIPDYIDWDDEFPSWDKKSFGADVGICFMLKDKIQDIIINFRIEKVDGVEHYYVNHDFHEFFPITIFNIFGVCLFDLIEDID